MRIKRNVNESVVSVLEINEINKIWEELINHVYSDIKTNDVKYYGFQTFCSREFQISIENIGTISVKYVIYLLESNAEVRYLYNSGVNLSCMADYDAKTLEIRGMFIGNKPYKGLYSELSHEFHHLYQYSKGFSKTTFTNNLYEKVRNGYQSDNEVIATTSMALYYTFKHEISAFSAELYQYLIKNKKQYPTEFLTVDDLYDASPNFLNFEDKADLFKKYKGNKENVQSIENYFGLNIEHISKRIENAFNMWYTYFSKVLAKYKLSVQLDGHNGVNESCKFMHECINKGYILMDDLKLD